MTGRNKAGRGKTGSSGKGKKPQAKRPHATIEGKAEHVSKDVGDVKLSAAAAKEMKARASAAVKDEIKSSEKAQVEAPNPGATATKEKAEKPGKKRSKLLPLALVGLLGGAAALFGGQYFGTTIGGSSNTSKEPATTTIRQNDKIKTAVPIVDPQVTAKIDELGGHIKSLQSKLAAMEAAQKTAAAQKVSAKLDEASAKKIADLEATVQSQNDKIAKLETSLGDLKTMAETNRGAVSRVDSLEKTLKTLAESGAGDAKGSPTSLALATRVNELENSLNEKLSAVETSVTKSAGASESVGKLESQVAEAAKTTKGLQSAIDGLNKTGAGVEAKIKTMNKALSQQTSGLKSVTSQVAALAGTAVKQDALKEVITPLSEKIGGLEESLSSVKENQAASAQNAKRSALTIAMAALKREIDAGRSYENSLKAVKTLAPNALDFSRLEPFADTGLASQAQLLKEYKPLADEAAALNLTSKAANGSIWDKVKASAKNAVKWRKSSDVSGDGNEAIIARIENQLKKGDGNAALKEAEGLKGKVKNILSPWLEKLQARVEVGQTLAALEGKIFEGFKAKASAQ